MAVKKKSVIIIIGLTGLIALCVLISRINFGIGGFRQSFAGALPSTHSILKEDSGILLKEYWNKLKADIIYNRKDRNPISLLIYDKLYLLLIYRMDLHNNSSLKELVHAEIRSVYEQSGLTYSVINHNDFVRIQHQIQPQKQITNIYLTLSGDSLINQTQSDTIVSYNLRCDNISIRYSANEPADIIIVGDERAFGKTLQIPMSLSLVKNNNSVFLLIMTPNTEQIPMDYSLLSKILS